jgi:hypothetical protein
MVRTVTSALITSPVSRRSPSRFQRSGRPSDKPCLRILALAQDAEGDPERQGRRVGEASLEFLLERLVHGYEPEPVRQVIRHGSAISGRLSSSKTPPTPDWFGGSLCFRVPR